MSACLSGTSGDDLLLTHIGPCAAQVTFSRRALRPAQISRQSCRKSARGLKQQLRAQVGSCAGFRAAVVPQRC